MTYLLILCCFVIIGGFIASRRKAPTKLSRPRLLEEGQARDEKESS